MASIDLSHFERICQQVPCPACGSLLVSHPDPAKDATVLECTRCRVEPLIITSENMQHREQVANLLLEWHKKASEEARKRGPVSDDEDMWLGWCDDDA